MIQMAGAQIVNKGKHFPHIGIIGRQDQQGAPGLDGRVLGKGPDQIIMGPVAVDMIVNQIQNQRCRPLVVKEPPLEFTGLGKQKLSLPRLRKAHGRLEVDQFSSQVNRRVHAGLHHHEGAHGRAGRFSIGSADIDHLSEETVDRSQKDSTFDRGDTTF